MTAIDFERTPFHTPVNDEGDVVPPEAPSQDDIATTELPIVLGQSDEAYIEALIAEEQARIAEEDAGPSEVTADIEEERTEASPYADMSPEDIIRLYETMQSAWDAWNAVADAVADKLGSRDLGNIHAGDQPPLPDAELTALYEKAMTTKQVGRQALGSSERLF